MWALLDARSCISLYEVVRARLQGMQCNIDRFLLQIDDCCSCLFPWECVMYILGCTLLAVFACLNNTYFVQITCITILQVVQWHLH